jgi:hypothetical protein
MSRALLVAVLLVAGSSVPAAAAPLGAKKPSQFVTLEPDPVFGTAPCTGVEAPLTRVLQPDLSTVPLVIPEGQVLVITSGSWEQNLLGTVPNSHSSLRLFLKDGVTQGAVFFGSGTVLDSNATGSGSFRVDPGFIVRPGQTICAVFSVAGADKGGTVFAYGYLTKDK